MSTPWSNLQQKPMSRKEFLKLLAVGGLVALNLEAIIKLLTGHSLTSGNKPVDVGYSSGGYSGIMVGQKSTKKSGNFDS